MYRRLWRHQADAVESRWISGDLGNQEIERQEFKFTKGIVNTCSGRRYLSHGELACWNNHNSICRYCLMRSRRSGPNISPIFRVNGIAAVPNFAMRNSLHEEYKDNPIYPGGRIDWIIPIIS